MNHPRAKKPRQGKLPVHLPDDAPALGDESRELLEAWWQRRCVLYPRADRLRLGRFSLAAISHAQASGVLDLYLAKAQERGWQSLGHPGMRDVVQALALEQAAERGALAHPEIGTLEFAGPKAGRCGRRQQFLDETLRIFTSVNASNVEQQHPA